MILFRAQFPPNSSTEYIKMPTKIFVEIDELIVRYGVRVGEVQKKTRLALYTNRSPLMRREGAAVRLASC